MVKTRVISQIELDEAGYYIRHVTLQLRWVHDFDGESMIVLMTCKVRQSHFAPADGLFSFLMIWVIDSCLRTLSSAICTE